MGIEVEGVERLERDFVAVDERLNGPLNPILATLEESMVANFRANVQSGGSRLAALVTLPPEHPATAAIRRHFGHAGKPRLVRGGDLAADIRGLARTGRFVEVGTTLPNMAVLHDGGELVDRRGRRRTVRPHPFLLSTVEDLDGYQKQVAEYFIDEPLGVSGG